MSQENVEVVRRGYRLYAAGDLDGVAGLFSPDAEVADAGGLGVTDTAAGSRSGPEGFLRANEEALEAFEDYRVEVEELIDAGEAVVAPVRISGRGRASGAGLDARLTHLWVFRDGKVIRGEVYRTTEEALKAAGLRGGREAAVELKREGGIAYREAIPTGEPSGSAVVCVHGFPESSRMWAPLLAGLAASGRRSAAPDLYGLGESTGFGPATFEHALERFGTWVDALGLGSIALVVHDWGAFVGLAWACEHPDRVEALVISDAGFFADGKWHGMAQALRSDKGEEIIGALDRDGFAGLLNSTGEIFDEADLDAYWAPFAESAGGRGQRSTLEFYRSMDFEKLAPWQGKLAELEVPTLLLWGAEDPFAPLAGARRFEREIPGSRLVAIEGAGHFVFDQHRKRCVDEVVAFITGQGASVG